MNAESVLMIDYGMPQGLIPLPIRRRSRRIGMRAVRLGQLRRLHPFREGEERLPDETYFDRLMAMGDITDPDVRVLEELLRPECQHLIPPDWEEGHTYFFGSIFDEAGKAVVPYLYRDHHGIWQWGLGVRGYGWSRFEHAAVIVVAQGDGA